MSKKDTQHDIGWNHQHYGYQVPYQQNSATYSQGQQNMTYPRLDKNLMKNKKDKDMETKKFIITVCHKNGHPLEGRITNTNDALAVNGIPGAPIHLRRGRTYQFEFQQSYDDDDDTDTECYGGICTHRERAPRYPQEIPYRIYFTADPVGGPPGTFSQPNYCAGALPMTAKPQKKNCTIDMKVGSKFPTLFYYQTTQRPFMGGPIIVHDEWLGRRLRS